MCIRDRLGGAGDLRDLELLPEDLRDHLVVEHEIIRAQVVRCLLYTSDAADERSSVDLGGRRIIKKKKSAQSARRHTTA